MIFAYKAQTKTGEVISGQKDCPDQQSLLRQLNAEGLSLLYANEVVLSRTTQAWSKLFSGGRIRLKDKILFAGNLGSMIKAGLNLSRALAVMSRQTSNQALRKVIDSLVKKIGQGEAFSTALQAHPHIFDDIFVAMVAAAEESGNLPQSLKILNEQMAKTYDLRRKVKGAMIYPAVILSAMLVIGFLMLVFLVPVLTATFKELGSELPWSTKLIIWFSDSFSSNLTPIIIILVVLLLGVGGFLRSRAGRHFIDYVSLHMPGLSRLTKQINAATSMRTLSSLISSGVDIVRSLDISSRVVKNHYYRQVLAQAGSQIQQGLPLSKVFIDQEKLFPAFVGEMTLVGEETGQLPQMLLEGALFYEAEVDQSTKNLSTIIEPVLMIMIGLAVGIFAIALLGPMYSLSDVIGA